MPSLDKGFGQAIVECTCKNDWPWKRVEALANISNKPGQCCSCKDGGFNLLGNLPPYGRSALLRPVASQAFVCPKVQEAKAFLGSD